MKELQVKKPRRLDSLLSAKWRMCEFFSFNDAMNLIFDYEPDSYYFSSYNERNLQEEFIPVYRKIKNDIINFSMPIYCDNNIIIDCYETAAKSLELTQDKYQYEDWWMKCSMRFHDIKKWLEDNNITSKFFSTEFKLTTSEITELLNVHNEFYSRKLAAAVKAWLYFNENGINNKKSPKDNIQEWIRKNAEELDLIDGGNTTPSKQTVEDISKVVNWNTEGGAPTSTK